MTLPRYVRKKVAKGRTYYYFETGRKDEAGKPILTRLPDVRGAEFGRALATANAARNRKPPASALMTVAKMADLWQNSQIYRKRATSTQTSYNHYLKRIVIDLGVAPVDDVKRADVAMLMDKRGKTPAAANQIVRVLGALYAWGRKQGHTTARPTEDVELNEIGEHDPWPEWLIEQALESDDATVSLATALLYFTAQRIGDMLKMRWTDIREGRIAVKQEKTGTTLEIAIHERLAGHLAKAPRRGFTILSQEDGRKCRQDKTRNALQAFAAERGLKVVPHGLRKNAVNALLEAGCSIAETQAVSGQSLQMIEHYAKKRNRAKLADAAVLKWEKKTGDAS